MSWFKTYFQSTIGKKQIMAVTGLGWALWLLAHLAGNLAILSPQKFNEYAHLLTSNKPLLYGMEVVITVALLLHVYLAFSLRGLNKSARPVAYGFNAKSGDRGWASFNMILTGVLVLIFLVIHLKTFKYGPYYTIAYDGGAEIRDIHRLVLEQFSLIWYSGFYIVVMALLAFHLGHGVGSAFQTLGFNHPRYNKLIRNVSVGYAAVVSLGFIAITIYGYMKGASVL